jgi:hypothetical protein
MTCSRCRRQHDGESVRNDIERSSAIAGEQIRFDVVCGGQAIEVACCAEPATIFSLCRVGSLPAATSREILLDLDEVCIFTPWSKAILCKFQTQALKDGRHSIQYDSVFCLENGVNDILCV